MHTHVPSVVIRSVQIQWKHYEGSWEWEQQLGVSGGGEEIPLFMSGQVMCNGDCCYPTADYRVILTLRLSFLIRKKALGSLCMWAEICAGL